MLAVGLWAEVSPAAPGMPSNQQVIDFLTDSIGWYRQRSIERQIATDPVDVVFLEDRRPIAEQIVQLSFDFARADTLVASMSPAGNQKGNAIASNSSPDLPQFVQLETNAELARQQASQHIGDLKKKLVISRGAERRRSQAALDAAQSRLEVLEAASAMLRQLVESTQSFGGEETGNLLSMINDLAQTVPNVIDQTAAGTQTQRSDLPPVVKQTDSGILALSSEVSALERKLRIVDAEILQTDKLKQSSNALRIQLLDFVRKRFHTDIAIDVQANDLSVLQQQKARLDELTALVKTLSPAIVALAKQESLLYTYTSHLKNWRAAVLMQDKKAWKNLSLRLAGPALVIAALAMIGTITRRAIRRHVQDGDRRAIMLLIQRAVLWFTVVVVAAFALASDLTSLATFFGLLTAGVAVALQSVIVSALGYFMLVGRIGIRTGDRVQISGVTGDVIEIGLLQFNLKEIDGATYEPTGRVVRFSNSFVFLSPATGLSKFSRKDSTPAMLAAAAKAIGR